MKKIIFLILWVIGMNSYTTTAYCKSEKSTVNIVVSDDGKKPFSVNVPVQSLMTVQSMILGQLLYTGNSHDLKPGLLESYKWNYSEKRYELTLKKGLKFHSGRPVTSKDLEFSIIRGFYNTKGSWFKSFFNNIEGVSKVSKEKRFKSGSITGIKIIDDLTIHVKLSSPNPSFLHSLARTTFSLVPIEEMNQDYETWKTVPVGAGPYKVSRLLKNNDLILEKISNKSIEVIVSPNGISDKSDILLYDQIESSKYKFHYSKNAARVTSIYFNYHTEISNNKYFRLAIAYALNRKPLANEIAAYKENNEFLASHFWGRINKKERYDVEKAIKYLEKVKSLNLTKVYEIPVFNSNYSDPKLGNYLKIVENQLSAIGLKIKFINSKNKFMDKNDTETLFKILSMGADVVDPTVLFALTKSPIKQNFPYKDKKYHKLLESCEVAESLDQRVLSLKNISNYVFENAFIIPLFERKSIVSYNVDRIKDLGEQSGGMTFYLDKIRMR